MVRNNYNEPNKVTLASSVKKALDLALSKKNIKNGFQVTRIWPLMEGLSLVNSTLLITTAAH
jgi:hypothetical protein